MKIEKKHWIIIAIVVILIALWYFFIRKKTATTTSKYAGTYGSFGNESNWIGNATYNDCHKNCIKGGGSVSNCDQGCGRGTKAASA